jgi:cleavage and polyadenylation specificity factor subunit 1
VACFDIADLQVYIFEVVETVGGPGRRGSGWSLKMRCKDHTRNPVSAITHINGYLLHSNGPKVGVELKQRKDGLTEQIYVRGLDDDSQLMGLAFLDVTIYVTSIKVFKNFILVSDLVKSMWFVALQVGCVSSCGAVGQETDPAQEDPYRFTTIAKDLSPISLLDADFMVHEGKMTFISNDRFGEMRMVDYDPMGKCLVAGKGRS